MPVQILAAVDDQQNLKLPPVCENFAHTMNIRRNESAEETSMSKRGIFSVYRDQMRHLLPERDVKGSRSYQAKFSYETIAAVGTAAQMAIGGS